MKKHVITPLERSGRHITDAKFPTRRFSAVCLAAVFFIILITGVSAQEKRYALVIGNGNYTDLGRLNNPVNDATDMASALTSLGFTVELLIDADQATMNESVISFGNQLSTSSDSVGFFYYAGHGVQSADGQNYLIPIGAKIPAEAFLGQSALAMQTVLDIIRSANNHLNIVVLDACRNNPFSWSRSATRGLAVIKSPPPGSIISYAADAGQVAQDGTGRNGIYTGELLKHLKTPGLGIDDIFKRTGAAVSADTNNAQTPAVYSLFYGEFYLTGKKAETAASNTAQAGTEAPTTGTFSVRTAVSEMPIVFHPQIGVFESPYCTYNGQTYKPGFWGGFPTLLDDIEQNPSIPVAAREAAQTYRNDLVASTHLEQGGFVTMVVSGMFTLGMIVVIGALGAQQNSNSTNSNGTLAAVVVGVLGASVTIAGGVTDAVGQARIDKLTQPFVDRFNNALQ